MMWENPSVGVHVPKGCQGRATTVDESNRPVEIQTYFTPDPRKAADPAEIEALALLRPKASRWPRLVIVPPVVERDLDAEDGSDVPLTYPDYAHTDWLLASDRPDLAPSSSDARSDRTVDSSPMAVLGLGYAIPTDRTNTLSSTEVPAPDQPQEPSQVAREQGSVVVDTEGYGEVEAVEAGEVQPGWLVQVDPDGDQWAVVEAPPEPDPFDEDLFCVPWRDDFDNAGTLTVEDDLIVRRPLEAAHARQDQW